MNHLVYFTFGGQEGSVYATQVKQLLNYWCKRHGWKVTLIQIADDRNFNDLDLAIEQIFIKRKSKLLFSFQFKAYLRTIKKELQFRPEDTLYFNSRGASAFLIATKFIEVYNLDVQCNNLDVRGTIKEFKISNFRKLFYLYFKNKTKKALKKATSITTVTSNLKEHLLSSFNINPQAKINVNPTLSILENSFKSNKKNIAYIGKIAWIDSKTFVDQLLKINKLFLPHGWNISIIGNSSGSFGLETHGVKIVERMTPDELAEYITNYHTGIVLRDNSIINKVAAPCKISDYLCLGMPVIYSGEIGSLKDFTAQFPECKKFIVHINEFENNARVEQHLAINQDDLSLLSMNAQKYFGVEAVIDRYITIFNS